MKNILSVLITVMFGFLTCSAMAATDTKTINLQVVQGTYAELTGSAVDGGIGNINMNSITNNKTISLGTLGVKSNGSDCSIAFSTVNNFALKHDFSGALLKRYKLNYLGNTLSSNSETKIKLDSCVMSATALDFISVGATPSEIEDGLYKDIVTIILTTE